MSPYGDKMKLFIYADPHWSSYSNKEELESYLHIGFKKGGAKS